MKRKLGILGLLGAGALTLGLCCGKAAAQGAPPTGQAALKTRVAVVNFHEVIKNYKKLDLVRQKSREMFEMYEGKLKLQKEEFDKLQRDLQSKGKEMTPAQREEIETKMNKIRFEMDSITKQGQKAIMTYEQEALAGIYREVNKIVADYAKANGIDLVFRFNEDWGDDYHKPANVVDRLKHPMWPMYWDPSLNITGAVKATLDRQWEAESKTGVNPVKGP